jgi:hypothetical protein
MPTMYTMLSSTILSTEILNSKLSPLGEKINREPGISDMTATKIIQEFSLTTVWFIEFAQYISANQKTSPDTCSYAMEIFTDKWHNQLKMVDASFDKALGSTSQDTLEEALIAMLELKEEHEKIPELIRNIDLKNHQITTAILAHAQSNPEKQTFAQQAGGILKSGTSRLKSWCSKRSNSSTSVVAQGSQSSSESVVTQGSQSSGEMFDTLYANLRNTLQVYKDTDSPMYELGSQLGCIAVQNTHKTMALETKFMDNSRRLDALESKVHGFGSGASSGFGSGFGSGSGSRCLQLSDKLLMKATIYVDRNLVEDEYSKKMSSRLEKILSRNFNAEIIIVDKNQDDGEKTQKYPMKITLESPGFMMVGAAIWDKENTGEWAIQKGENRPITGNIMNEFWDCLTAVCSVHASIDFSGMKVKPRE